MPKELTKIVAFNVFFTICMLLSFMYTKSQNYLLAQKITIAYENQTLPGIFDIISNAANINFSYNPDIVPKDVTFSGNFSDKSLEHILNTITVSMGLSFDIFENQIIIFNKANTPEYFENEEIDTIVKIKKISGKIIEHTTQKPIPFAHVVVLSKLAGTISNKEGNFDLNISELSFNDTLEISYIGYKTNKIPIVELDTTEILISLIPNSIELPEVDVKPVNIYEILQEIFDNISSNYPLDQSILTAFYRETIKQDDNYISLSEAIVEIYKNSYKEPYNNDKIKLVRGRKTQDYDKMKQVLFTLMGGLFYSLKLDIVKEKPSFLDNEYYNYYEYDIDEIIDYKGRSTYIVSFKDNSQKDDYLYTGKLYIDKERKAIAGAEFYLSKQALKHAKKILVKKSPRKFRVKPLYAHYRVDYTLQNNQWNLYSAHSEMHISVKHKEKDINSIFSTTSEFIITDNKSSNIQRFKKDEIARPNDVFFDQISDYNAGFWGSYNIIKPDESIEEAYKNLSKQKSLILRENQK